MTGTPGQALGTDPPGSHALLDDYRRVRGDTERLCAPLQIEDYGIQTMPDVSPAKWHLAHTSWFFETFVLLPHLPGYRVHHPAYDHLFNSYYVTHGQPYARPARGLLSRPTVAEVYAYRAAVDLAMAALLARPGAGPDSELGRLVTLGLQHEQQHQELLLTDLKHVFAHNPLRPVYASLPAPPEPAPPPLRWCEYAAGLRETGHGDAGFAYDNEQPRHRTWLEPYVLASRPVTNAEYLGFVQDGGYREPGLWLSDGWAAVQAQHWQAPLYWEARDGEWWHMTLGGMRPVDPHAPVAHVSLYEADAYARWCGRRLPTEAEWEAAVAAEPVTGNLREAGFLQPVGAGPAPGLAQCYGDVWEWTASSYGPYPGYRPPAGTLGEYNGKFMSGQNVLRGGSCVTPADHIRASYRNFFYAKDRWQFSGIRLAGEP